MTANKPSRRPRTATARPVEEPRLFDLTAPVEDYLKAIYEIELSASAAATNDIAHRLNIAPA